MKKGHPPRQSRVSLFILGLFVLVLLAVLVLLQSTNLWKDFSVESAGDTLVLYALSSVNFIAFVVFGFIFLRSIIRLGRERRSLQVGSKLKTRLLVYFVAVSILPIVAMAAFSYLFMNRALERWFTQIPENVVRQARDVQTQAASNQAAQLQNTARMLASALGGEVTEADLAAIANAGRLSRVELLSGNNELLLASETPLNEAQRPEMDAALAAIRQGGFDSPELADGRGFDAAVAALADGRKLVIIPAPRGEQSVTHMVESSLREFDRLKDKQITVRQIGFLTLGVLTFLLIFAATWTALYIGRVLTAPIRALAEGAGEIASGNLKHRVDVFAEDELALLVSAFNEMSAKLEENSVELRERRRYIETLLQSLPIGVVSVDSENRVDTINRAALAMLDIEGEPPRGSVVSSFVSDENAEAFERLIGRARRTGHAVDQTKLLRNSSLNGEPDVTVALTAASLPETGGVVLLIEDLSELIAAQRASAWREVARRMAHEIKNPLTPIQLSAERIARRFRAAGHPAGLGGLLSPDDQTASVVSEGTDTILREVRSLKAMVDEFSRFARLPEAKLESGDLNNVIKEVIALYEDRLGDITVEAALAEDLPPVMLDRDQMKRVFVNLLDNAIEAVEKEDGEKRIVVSTRYDAQRDRIVAEISDTGHGITPQDMQRLFQPYFSTKGRGTGLGLAIVHRIVSDHGGGIKASNLRGGASFIVELPVASEV